MTGMQPHFQRAMILFQQNRHADAERELRQALSFEPSNSEVHAMLALCLSELKRHAEATAEAQYAIALAPDQPMPYYALANVMVERNRYDEALDAVKRALQRNAHEPAYFALLAAIYFGLRQWPAALEAAERGLAIDPEHERCVNLRAMALVKLGRRAEAGDAIGSALRRDPDDALTHANMGWALLHNGEHRKAMEHFREALRLQPNLDWARAGMVESLKARNPIYKIMLAWFLFMGRLSGGAQWGIVLGGYFGARLLRATADNVPSLRPFVLPLIVLYIVFALMTWVADPLFNLLLRLDRFGRHALSRKQTIAANCTGLVLLATAALGILAWRLHSEAVGIAVLGALVFLIPTTAIFKAPEGWPRCALIAYAAVLGILGATALWGIIPAAMSDLPLPEWVGRIGMAYFWGVFLHQFIANGLFGVTVKR